MQRVSRKFLGQKGVSLIATIAIASVLSLVALFVFDYLNNMKKASKNLELQLKAKMLSEDALELAKYLLFYEKIFSINNPKQLPVSLYELDDSAAKRGRWVKACASLDYTPGGPMSAPTFSVTRTDGTNIVDETFCTTDLKDFRLSGQNWDTYLNKLSTLPNTRIEKIEDGRYKLKTIQFSPQDTSNPDEFIKFGIEEKFKIFIKSIEVDLYFYTKEAGFDSMDNERFIKISAKVKYGDKQRLLNLGESVALSEETLMFRASTIKGFALFMAYPENTSLGHSSKNFSSMMNLNGGEIHGRTYFRYDLDLASFFANPLTSTLPTFFDTLILGGDVKNFPAPTSASIASLKQKFRRGIIPNFADEYIFDTATVNNLTGGLMNNYRIRDYVKNPSAIAYCIDPNGADNLVNVVVNASAISSCSDENVGSMRGPYTPVKGKNISQINVQGNRAFVMGTSEQLNLSNGASLYGVYLGGKITGTDAKIYSLEMMRDGLPGIDSTTGALKLMNTQANRTNDLIGAPLRNLPIVMRGR